MAEKQILIWTGSNDEALSAGIDALDGARSTRASDRADALAEMHHADALVTSAAIWDRDFANALAVSPRLEWIQIITAGFDNIESLGVPSHITVSTSGPVAADVVAEHALMLLLALVRIDAQSRGEWIFPAIVGSVGSLHDATIAVLGFGHIGRAVTSLAQTFGARVVPVARRARGDVETYDNLPTVLERSDALVITAPLTKITQHMIKGPVLSEIKPGAYLVNVSRGRIIDTDALIDALDNGVLAGAALDVTDPEPLPPEHPLWLRPNVIITPHIASAGGGYRIQQQLQEVVVENVRRFVLGKRVQYIAPIEYN
jgi:phosphoglycerate dehydrogenase-like enzyme